MAAFALLGRMVQLIQSRAIASARPTCPVCAAALGEPRVKGCDRLHGTEGSFAVAVCQRCGAGRTLPPLEDEQLGALYPAGYGPHDDSRMSAPLRAISWAIRRRQARAAWREPPIRALHDRRPGRGLDVGCGRGELDAMLIGHGWRMDGIEPSPEACAAAVARGVEARCGTLATVELEDELYDMVVFRHSLEHTNDPIGDLRRAGAAMRQDGLLLVSVPNFGCWQAKRFRSRWYHLDLPRHRTHFTHGSLRLALRSAGFECVEVATTTSTLGLAGSIQYRLFGHCLFPGGLALRVASGLAAQSRPLARLINRMTGGGDELQVVARRAIALSTSSATASAGPG